MTQFLSEELNEEMYDLTEYVYDLHDILEEARFAENYEDFNSLMENAYIHTHSISSGIDELREMGNELHLNEEDDDTDVDDDSGEY